MNATDQKRKKMRTGRGDSNGEIAKLTRVYDWSTTDQDEIRLRQQRAKEEQPQIRNLEPTHRIFSQFEVRSPSGMTYLVDCAPWPGACSPAPAPIFGSTGSA